MKRTKHVKTAGNILVLILFFVLHDVCAQVNVALNKPVSGDGRWPELVDGDTITPVNIGDTYNYGESYFKECIIHLNGNYEIFRVKIYGNETLDYIKIHYYDETDWHLAFENHDILPYGISTLTFDFSEVIASKVKIGLMDIDSEIDNFLNEIEVYANAKVEFTYDDSGNRTGRTLVPVLLLKSAFLDDKEIPEQLKTEEEEELSESDVLVYPNPTERTITVYINKELEGDVYFGVFDINGRQIASDIYRGDRQYVDLGDFAPGIYFLKIINNNKTVVKRIIKE